MNKSILVTISAIFVFTAAGAGLYYITQEETVDNANEFSATTVEQKQETVSSANPEVIESKLIIGNTDAKVTIIEYVDYKCPNCNRFSRTTEPELKENYSDEELNIEIRMTPIIGPDSGNSARGAYCANEQDVFESYHQIVLDYMWDNFYEAGNFSTEFEDILTTDKLAEFIKDEQVDIESFKSCVNSDKFNPALDRDLLAAADDGVRGTPGFVVGGQSFVGLQPLSVFTALIDNQL